MIGAVSIFASPASVALATEDVTVLWKEATFRAKSELGSIEVAAATRIQGQTFRLSKLTIHVAGKDVPCPAALYSDLDYPQLETIQLVEQYKAPLQIRLKFGEHSTYLGEGVTDYPQVRIDFARDGCSAREFSVPKPGGVTRYQSEKP